MKANIILGKEQGSASIILDGHEVSQYTGALRVTRMDGAVNLVASAGTMPTLELTLMLNSVSVSADGDLLINAEPVSDTVGKAIYESLKNRYDPEA